MDGFDRNVPEADDTTLVASPPDERVWIRLEDSEAVPPTGLFVGLNGRGYLLRTSVPLHVPKGVLEILRNAKEAQPVFDPTTLQVLEWVERPKYQFSIVEAPAG